jgi:hypothetical protein
MANTGAAGVAAIEHVAKRDATMLRYLRERVVRLPRGLRRRWRRDQIRCLLPGRRVAPLRTAPRLAAYDRRRGPPGPAHRPRSA